MERNVLIVDDTHANLVAMRLALRGLPFLTIHEAHSGNEALGKLIRHDFALIFMDVRMPVMNGYETACAILEVEEYGNIPLVFVTGNDGNHEIDVEFRNSIHLYKPISKEEVHRVVTDALFRGEGTHGSPIERNAAFM